MNRLLFFVMLAALIGTVIYGYFAPEKPPDKAFTLTPGEFIQQVEKNKAAGKSRNADQVPSNAGSDETDTR